MASYFYEYPFALSRPNQGVKLVRILIRLRM